jgi:hypothetical protein
VLIPPAAYAQVPVLVVADVEAFIQQRSDCTAAGMWHGLDVAVKRVVFQGLGQGQEADERRQQVGRGPNCVTSQS